MAEFSGFPAEGLAFLTELGHHDKPWFDDHRSTYDTSVVKPAKAFVTAVGERLAERISPAIEALPKTNGSIAPINNDLRFSPDAVPYKDHLLFRFWEGPTKKTAPTLMIRLHPVDGVGFAAGVVVADLDRWRQAIADDVTGTELAAALDQLVTATRAEVVGEEVKKVPKPYDLDHPRAGLLRRKGFQVRWLEKLPKDVSTAGFADWCVDRLVGTSDVHRWLVRELV